MDDIEDDEPIEPNYFDKYKELKVGLCLKSVCLKAIYTTILKASDNKYLVSIRYLHNPQPCLFVLIIHCLHQPAVHSTPIVKTDIHLVIFDFNRARYFSYS